jgi:hypothetical protein
LQLGHGYVVSGNTANTKVTYRNFLTLWKDADIPILKEAKTAPSRNSQRVFCLN